VIGPSDDANVTVGPPPSTNPESDVVESIPEFQARWSASLSTNSTWVDFSDKMDQFAIDVVNTCNVHYRSPKNRPGPRRPNRPSARPANNNRQPIGYNPVEARKIQTLYRISKKRAARKIIDDSKPSYSGSVEDANDFFERVFGPRNCDVDKVKSGLNEFVPSGPADDNLGTPTTPKEVEKKLKSLSNSAPGVDRVEYRHLKTIDPKGSLLSSIFNRCLAEEDVPSQWKIAQTILIHKKGDASDISNFRPIALMSCIYKLFASIIANRLVSFSINNDLLSSAQKSARPSEGCYEHTFILQSLILDANRHDKNIYLAWLDLRNAFGSVPHEVISTTLSHLGVPDSVVSLIGNIYTNAFTEVRTPAGNTSSIPILSGVKQGCPLSPIIFNLSIELILRAVNAKAQSIGAAKHFASDISVLAYADDLVIITRNPDKLQKLLDAASETASILGLEFRPDKCASLSLTYGKQFKDNIQLRDYIVQGKAIPSLRAHEHYRYLGVPIGMIREVTSLEKLAEDLCVDLDRIANSLLAPWQKLDMIRTFVQPCLTYVLRAGEPLKASLTNYRKKLIEVVRSICNLPLRATSHFVFAPIKVGGLGFQDPKAEVDVQTVVQAIKMLSSSDPFVSAVAIGELRKAVRFAARADPSPALMRDFMSGSTRGNFHRDRIRYRTHSLWTRARCACRRLGLTFAVPDNESPAIYTNTKGPCLAKSASSFLHRHVQDRAAEKLMDFPDQGKVARALVNDSFGNGSAFLYTGLNIRFRDWRFVHRARLNVVPTNQNKARWCDVSSNCRKCGDASETLPHILNHCEPSMTKIRERHNSIVSRLANAIKSGDVRIDKQVPGIDDECRPDIVIQNDDEVLIIDVTCPFENGENALAEADFNKVAKYDHVKRHYQSLGKRCSVHGFVIGSLGTWHPDNEAVLSKLMMTKSYKSLFRKLCCTDVIKGSADIYYNHMVV
jgi:hypothetical protein